MCVVGLGRLAKESYVLWICSSGSKVTGGEHEGMMR